LRVAQEDEQDAEGLGLNGQGFAGFREGELALADLDVGEAKMEASFGIGQCPAVAG
jgi:hypothetical protein